MFKMTQKEEESLEDYLERFHYIVKRALQNHLYLDTLKVIFLRRNIDEWINVLNLMGKGYISHLTYPKICDLCKHISRWKSKYGKGPKDAISRVNKSTTNGVSRTDIDNLLDNFKIDILSTIGSQLDAFKIKQKKEVEDAKLTICCPKCRERHPFK